MQVRLIVQMRLLFAEEMINIKPTVGTKAIQSVQLEFEWKRFAHEHASQGGFAHLERILELHVMADRRADFVDLLSGKLQSLQNLAGHFSADFLVSVKMHQAVFAA